MALIKQKLNMLKLTEDKKKQVIDESQYFICLISNYLSVVVEQGRRKQIQSGPA